MNFISLISYLHSTYFQNNVYWLIFKSNSHQLSIFPSPILKKTYVIIYYFTFTVLG